MLQPHIIEDRTAVVTIDTTDSATGVVVDRYIVTTANTVIVQDGRTEDLREFAFDDIGTAFAFCIEQTGFAQVVDVLADYLSDEALPKPPWRDGKPDYVGRNSDGAKLY